MNLMVSLSTVMLVLAVYVIIVTAAIYMFCSEDAEKKGTKLECVKKYQRKFYLWKDARAKRAYEEWEKYYACDNNHCIYNLGNLCGSPVGFHNCHKYEWREARKRKRREKVGIK